MPVERPEDRAVFVNGDEFGETVLWTVGEALPIGINVLGQAGTLMLGTIDGPDVQGQEASVVMPEANLPVGAADRAGDDDGDIVLFRGAHHRVKSIEPDGTGMAIVRIELDEPGEGDDG